MASWATRRQLIYLFTAIAFLAVLFSYPLFKVFYTAPSCTDGTQNQSETGIDCGGECDAVCGTDVTNLIVLWSQELEVRPGLYDAVAHIENPNPHAGIRTIPYTFKLYDENGVLVAERRGMTFVNANERFEVFEGAIDTGKRVPVRIFFEFTGAPEWVRAVAQPSAFSIQNQIFDAEEVKPKLKAELVNISLDTLRDIGVTALIFGHDGNILAASETHVDELLPDAVRQISFIWPQALSGAPARITVSPRINAFTNNQGD